MGAIDLGRDRLRSPRRSSMHDVNLTDESSRNADRQKISEQIYNDRRNKSKEAVELAFKRIGEVVSLEAVSEKEKDQILAILEGVFILGVDSQMESALKYGEQYLDFARSVKNLERNPSLSKSNSFDR